jgi:hypothetical protein
MSHPLDGCWAKIERAKENIKNLETEITAFVQTDNYVVIRNVDHKTMECTFTALPQSIPLRFPVLAGEVVHHLRSSLDHLIWALVLSRHKAPDFKVQFPICTTEQEFLAARKRGIVKGVSDRAQTILQSLQPYRDVNFGRQPDDNALAILHQLNIADKHTLLPVAVSATVLPSELHFYPGTAADTVLKDFVPAAWAGRRLRTEEGGTVVLKMSFTKMHPKLNVNADIRYQVAFDKFGTREVEPLVPSLTALLKEVIETIKLFDCEFI